MRYVPHDVRFKIAGTGPDEKKLKGLASSDPRIEFLDFVKEDQLADLYSKAIGVLYIPYDEDYGLITVEAMMSSKPVITASDSGGPLEFVNDGQTGFVAEPDPKKIAEKMNYFIENPQEAKRMGKIARKRAENITWERVVSKLVGEGEVKQSGKKKVLVLSTYSCYPPRGGGQHRIYNIYSRLAKEFDVTILSIIEVNKSYQNLILENGLKQICIPQSREHAELQWKIERDLRANLYDVCMIEFLDRSRDYVDMAKDLIKDAEVIIFSHPYLYGLSEFVSEDKMVIYEAHNSEYLLKKDYIKNVLWSDKVKDIENRASLGSDLILTTSEEDKKNIVDLYMAAPEKIFVSPNGVDVSKIGFITEEEKARQKEIVGLKERPTYLFVGSWHPPNLEALRFIVDIAKKDSNHTFLIVGSIRDYYLNVYGELPKNVLAFGAVDEDEKNEIYKLADIAINPMFSGSGTNIKMLDYMSAGIPIVSTSVGARGLGLEDNKHALISPVDQFSEKMMGLINNQQLKAYLRENGRALVEESFSWDKISKEFADKLKDIRH
jgi:glycosyltransferase involved in cell wall biosynthesis